MEKHTGNHFIYLAVLLLIQLSLLAGFGSTKQGMHFDELYSYFTTNYSGGRAVNDRAWLTSEDIRKDFYVLPGERFQYGQVVQMQSYDVHPPVFYLLLHTVCSLTPGVYSVWQGMGLNIVYALLTTVFLYAILRRLTGSSVLAFGISLLYVCNPGVITNVMLIRMYMLMTLWMMMAIWLHVCMEDQWRPAFIAANAGLAYLGFLTHYFYLIFLFFLEAAFWLPRLMRKEPEWKRFFLYAGAMLAAGILAVLSYPACLGHMFAGYRGKEAAGNLFYWADFRQRFSFFNTLLDHYVFQGAMFPVILLAAAAWVILAFWKRERVRPFVRCLLIPTAGFYLVSLKASLYGETAMLRYQLPIYGLTLVCVCVPVFLLLQEFAGVQWDRMKGDRAGRFGTIGLGIVFLVLLCLDLQGILSKNVYFCYPEQRPMVEYAREHAGDTVIYLYHRDEYKYLIWADAEQLWNYDKIYFVSTENPDVLEDPEIQNADKVTVYISGMGAEEDYTPYFDLIYRSVPGVSAHSTAYQSTYATAYYFEQSAK